MDKNEELLINLRKNIPEYVLNVADVLIDNNYEVFLVGGAVRDTLAGRPVKDYDLATNALPEQIEAIFPRTINTNAKFGTILVIMSDRTGERYDVDVTTYRMDEDYFAGRWPSKVSFTDDIIQDLSRRDFTINAIAVDMAALFDDMKVFTEIVRDPFMGCDDLDKSIIKAVGDPLERFGEDGLRAYKACRLASELGFEIEPNTFKAIASTLHIAEKISIERVRDEFDKLLKYSPKPSVGVDLLRESGLLALFIPELLECIDVHQPAWHNYDVYTHSLKALDIAEDSIKLAALLHDIGKPRTMSEDEAGIHFYGHDVVGSEIAENILIRMKYPKSVIKRNVALIRWHMFYYPSADWRNEEIQKRSSHEGGWSDSAVRRFIKNVGEEYIDDLFKLRIADATSNEKSEFDESEIYALEERIAIIRESSAALNIKDLDIDGHQLESLGINKGPEMGRILKCLLEEVLEDPILNKKETLLILAEKYKDN